MKNLILVVSIVLTSVGFIACSNEDVEATSANNNVDVTVQETEIQKLQSNIAKLNKEWAEKFPIVLTRGEQSNELNDEVAAKISITGADLTGAQIGKKYGKYGAIIGGVVASALALLEKLNEGSYCSVSIDYSAVDGLVFNENGEATMLDSIGYYHNQILMNIGVEELVNSSMDEIDELVLNSTIEVLGEQNEELTIDNVRSNAAVKYFKSNINRLNRAETPEDFCNILIENQDLNRDEVHVIKTYLDGLSTIDNTKAYTKEVLQMIDDSKLESSTAAELKCGVLVGNASQQLWIVDPQ